MEEIDLIYQFEGDCKKLSEDIISRLCKRAIATLKTVDSDLIDRYHSFPKNFNFWDILSIEIQSRTYEEIALGLEEGIDEVLEMEFNNLPAIERTILEYSECAEGLECNLVAVFSNIRSELFGMCDKHYYTAEIQNFIIKSDYE